MLLRAGCLPCPYKESERKREGGETEEEDWEMGKEEGEGKDIEVRKVREKENEDMIGRGEKRRRGIVR